MLKSLFSPPNIFSFLFTYLNFPVFYRNYNLGAEAVPYVATVTAQKGKKELGCSLLSG